MNHNSKKILTAVKIAGFTAAAAVLLVSAGCTEVDKSGMDSFFQADEGRATQNLMTAQAAAGARNDATLHEMHFDGGRLNSLGESKLDLMLKDDDSTDAVVVYMDLATDDNDLKSRRDAVMNYLEDRGVEQDHIEFKSGSNPTVTSLSAEHIANMHKTDSSGGSTETSSASSGGGMGASSPTQSK